MIARLAVLVLAALWLAGCVTATNTLSPDQVASFRLAEVRVGYAPGARVSWHEAEQTYVAARGFSGSEAAVALQGEETQTHVRDRAAAKLKEAMERSLRPELSGTRPVRAEVAIQRLEIAPPLQRILVGGAHALSADVTLVDAKTGAVLLAYPAQTAASMAGQGLGGALIDAAVLAEPIDRVTTNYATQYARWLTQR